MREVTEQDFRAPEFRDAKVEDYEFRDDGRIVRKDRWEMGIRHLAATLGLSRQGFEVNALVEMIEAQIGHWLDAEPTDFEEMLTQAVDLRLSCGSVLIGCEAEGAELIWRFTGQRFNAKDMGADVTEWRRARQAYQP